MWFYRCVRPWLTGIPWLIYRVRIEGREHLPPTGGFVIAPSHRSMMDILFTARVTTRRVRFMGKASLFKVPVLGAFFTALGGFPVARDGTDRKAVRDSVKMLEAGDVLCVYPEGTRQNGPAIQPLQPGAAYLALRAGVPIVPVGIAGAEEIMRKHKDPFPRFGRVTIVVGPPIVPEARASGVVARDKVDAMSAELADALQVVLDAANVMRNGASSIS
jgi:1-acyl-sn-glycerol-3-phosphate acyltransferase